MTNETRSESKKIRNIAANALILTKDHAINKPDTVAPSEFAQMVDDVEQCILDELKKRGYKFDE